MKFLRAFVFVLVVVCLPLWTCFATMVISDVNVAELATADVAFTGKCVDINAHVVAGYPATTFTFEVSREGVIKGNLPDKFSFTQYGVSRDDARRLNLSYVIGMPMYEKGKEYTVFLSKESSLGFRSTIGLGAGKFTVETLPDGKKRVLSEIGNKGLFENLPATKGMTKALKAGNVSEKNLPESGPVDYDTFVRIIKELGKGE